MLTNHIPRADQVAEQFKCDTAHHKLLILHDHGTLRHLRYHNTKTGEYWFDIITWSGCLTIRGDLPRAFTFSRLPDMFDFFRGKSLNPHYWSEKTDRGRRDCMTYDPDKLPAYLDGQLTEAEEDYPGVTQAWQKYAAERTPELHTLSQDTVMYHVNAFKYQPDPTQPAFTFEDTWDWDLDGYDPSFLWACHAILLGIEMYDAAKAAAAATTPEETA